MAKITDLLYLQNPWWRDAGFSFREAFWYKREIFEKLIDYIRLPQMTSLVGLRRTGKTTLLRQSIDLLLKEKTPPETICYFSFEEIGVTKETKVLEKVIEAYFKQVAKKEIREEGKVFFFFDEVQYIPYWQNILKRYYDLSKNIKFVISGSSSLFLRQEAKESLAGRMFEVTLFPWSLREFIAIKKDKIDIPRVNIWQSNNMPPELNNILSSRLLGLFLSYLSWGQFPELISFADFEKKRVYLREWIIDKIVERDLPLVLKIAYPEKLKALAYILLEGSGQEIEYINLGQDLGISRETVRHYVSFLAKSFLINQVLNSAGSFRRRERRSRKIYAASANFTSVVLGENEMGLNFQKNLGKIVETFVCTELISKFTEVFFWKERGKEVDFIVGDGKEQFPIEVKFQEKMRREDFKNILLLMNKKNYSKGYLLTKKHWEDKQFEGKTILLRPAFLI